MKRAAQVDIDYTCELIGGRVPDRGLECHAGVRDHHVQPVVTLDYAIDGGTNCAGVGNIDFDGVRGIEFVSECSGRRAVAVEQPDVRAFRAQRRAVAAPMPDAPPVTAAT